MISPQIFADFLDVPRPSNPVYHFPDPENTAYVFNTVASIIYGGDRPWASGLIYQNAMEVNYRLLNIFIASNVETRVHKSNVNCE